MPAPTCHACKSAGKDGLQLAAYGVRFTDNCSRMTLIAGETPRASARKGSGCSLVSTYGEDSVAQNESNTTVSLMTRPKYGLAMRLMV